MQKRDLSIDATRGIALFLVALSHAHHITHYLTAYYIMCFFLLSGFLYKPGNSYGLNVRKKAKRVLFPYFINSLILLLFYGITKSFDFKQVYDSLLGIVYSRSYIHLSSQELPIMGSIANTPLWYLTAFFATSLLFHLIVDNYTDKIRHTILLSLVLISVSIILCHVPILLPWSIDMVPFFCILMIAGYLAKKINYNLDLSITSTLIFLTAYVLCVHETGSINLSIRNMGWGGLFSALVIGILGTVVSISLCKKKIFAVLLPFFIKVGTNTIVVLSFHLAFIGFYRNLFSKFLPLIVDAVEESFIYDLSIVMLAILTCLVMGSIMDTIKSRFSIKQK